MAGEPISHGGTKTYWHLAAQRRIPTDYEIGSTRLLYYPTQGFATPTPAAVWMRTHGADVDLRCADWDEFADPDATTYTDYVSTRHEREAVIDGALRLADGGKEFDRRWRTTLARVLIPMRYPWHGLQMASAYLGHLAPGSRLAIAILFQTADLLRCVEGLDRRATQLRQMDDDIGRDARACWEDDSVWQPTRVVIERLLVTYRWSECFVALNLVVKPILDAWLLHQLSDAARTAGDEATRLLLWSLHEDTAWHRAWAARFATMLTADANNRRTLRAAVVHWLNEMEPVQTTLASLVGNASRRRAAVDAAQGALLRAASLEDDNP